MAVVRVVAIAFAAILGLGLVSALPLSAQSDQLIRPHVEFDRREMQGFSMIETFEEPADESGDGKQTTDEGAAGKEDSDEKKDGETGADDPAGAGDAQGAPPEAQAAAQEGVDDEIDIPTVRERGQWDFNAYDAAEKRAPFAPQSIHIGRPPQVVIEPEYRHQVDPVDPDNWVQVVPPGTSHDPPAPMDEAEKSEGEMWTGAPVTAREGPNPGDDNAVANENANATPEDEETELEPVVQQVDSSVLKAEQAAGVIIEDDNGYGESSTGVTPTKKPQTLAGEDTGYGEGYANPNEDAVAPGYAAPDDAGDAGYDM